MNVRKPLPYERIYPPAFWLVDSPHSISGKKSSNQSICLLISYKMKS